jgi:hypothetical protein
MDTLKCQYRQETYTTRNMCTDSCQQNSHQLRAIQDSARQAWRPLTPVSRSLLESQTNTTSLCWLFGTHHFIARNRQSGLCIRHGQLRVLVFLWVVSYDLSAQDVFFGGFFSHCSATIYTVCTMDKYDCSTSLVHITPIAAGRTAPKGRTNAKADEADVLTRFRSAFQPNDLLFPVLPWPMVVR